MQSQPSKNDGRCRTGPFVLICGALLAVGFAIAWRRPSPIEPVVFKYSDQPAPGFSGPLAVNDHLKRGKLLFSRDVLAPESFVVDKQGRVYTGLGDGRVIRFDRELESLETILHTGEVLHHQCGLTSMEDKCGRPLGLHFHHSDNDLLYIADSYKGLLLGNVTSGQVKTLVDAHHPGEGILPMKLTNDVTVLSNGSVFFTDSSSKFDRTSNRMEFLEGGGNGRLLHYNPFDRTVRVAAEGLHFANGITVAPDGEHLLISETTRARILRYHLKGPREGTTDVFVDNLPGLPDNIKPSLRGGYWVALAVVRLYGLLDTMASLPGLRSFIAKFDLLPILEKIIPTHVMVLELDEQGNVVRSLHDNNAEVTGPASTVLDMGDKLLLGSYFAPYLVVVPLDFTDAHTSNSLNKNK
eukprot:Em0015g219a